MNQLLRNNIARHVSLSEDQLQQFHDLFEPRLFKKKAIFYQKDKFVPMKVLC
ncbi:hypothetical protein ACRQ5D_33135 [Mucilaginibacter sp. P25]|uniref:hypothetical protein n=1 Tax=unclassified Mucilaginibacter TaxID=2617802 RepID=UPI003D66ACCB